MQEMQRPDGSMLSEQVQNGGAERRRTFVSLKPVSENKYERPHQGSKEIARRVKQMLKAAQKPTESA